MFERFSSAGRRAMVLAHEEADVRGQDFIGPAHIALGILRADAETSGGLLDRLGLGPGFVEELDAEAGAEVPGPGTQRGRPPFAPGAKKALEYSLREALQLGQNWIGLGHMLLGVLRAGDVKALSNHLPVEVQGIVARWEADQQARNDPEARSALRGRFRARPRAPRSEGNVAEGFTRVIHAAHDLARGPVGSQHLLLGIFDAGDTLARRVLESLDVSREKILRTIESTGSTGTLDEPPGSRVEVRVGEGTVMISKLALSEALELIEKHDAPSAAALRDLLNDTPGQKGR